MLARIEFTHPYEPHRTPYFHSASFHAISAMEACSLELRHEHGEACLEEQRDMTERSVTDDMS